MMTDHRHCDRDPNECSYEALVGEFNEVRRQRDELLAFVQRRRWWHRVWTFMKETTRPCVEETHERSALTGRSPIEEEAVHFDYYLGMAETQLRRLTELNRVLEDARYENPADVVAEVKTWLRNNHPGRTNWRG